MYVRRALQVKVRRFKFVYGESGAFRYDDQSLIFAHSSDSCLVYNVTMSLIYCL